MSTTSDRDPDFIGPILKPQRKPRFRLIRFLGVIGIVLLLVALFLPAMRSSREAAKRSQCVNNLKQITLALHNYNEAYGAFPPAYTVDRYGRPLHSWRTLILPYIEASPLYSTIDLTKPWNDPANARAYQTPVAVFHCPSVSGPSTLTTYLAVVGPNVCFLPDQPRLLAEITDPHTETLAVIEVDGAHAAHWMAPTGADAALVLSLGQGPSSKLGHPGGTNAALVDGSVRFLRATTTAQVRRALISIAGNDHAAAEEW
jgi:prepilin-type processing-associated H-X9-DG protein